MSMTTQVKQYQITYLLPPSFQPEQIDKITEKIKQTIIAQGGTTSQKETPSANLKKLAYPIKKLQEAFYLNLDFSLPAQSTKPLGQHLNLENDILRYSINAKKELKAKQDKKTKEAIDYGKMVEKIEPLTEYRPAPTSPELFKSQEKLVPETEKSAKEKSISDKKAKVKIEELDKKLEEILNQ